MIHFSVRKGHTQNGYLYGQNGYKTTGRWQDDCKRLQYRKRLHLIKNDRYTQ